MAKIFNNTDKTLFPSENQALSGWEKTPAYDAGRITHISDRVNSGAALSKMGTSIPTPFARIFLFKTAFEMVNGSADGHDDQSSYGKLVSECLDFIEFIFLYGNSIQVKAWNINQGINNLRNSASVEHKNLGKSLDNFARDLGVKDIYLIYYNGKLMGATSPFTVVYTSPNWQRNNPAAGAHGRNGNKLFPDYSDQNVKATPLYKRDNDFQIMLTRFYVAFQNIQPLGKSAFFSYIYANLNHSQVAKNEYDTITQTPVYSAANFTNDYTCIKDGNTDIDIIGQGGANAIFLAAGPKLMVNEVNIVEDDYKIKATSNRNGRSNEPLVLSEDGITGAMYVNRLPLPSNISIDRNLQITLENRILPGGQNINYPYVTDADFFQDEIIKVPYEVNTDTFLTFGVTYNGESSYLLPLRKEIFDYFSPSDFGKVKNLALKIEEKDENTVEATLRIPVQCNTHPYIDLVHEYEKSDIVKLMDEPDSFSLAVFPSYKILGGNVPNCYSVLFDDELNGIATKYFALNDNSIDEVGVADKKNNKRLTNGSRYQEINQAFDICELNSNGGTALLLPNFKEVKPSTEGNNTVVGIDFGTTNTYICYSTSNGAQPHTLDITKKDIQVLTLNKIDLSDGNYGEKYINSMYAITNFNKALDREYVPLLLGEGACAKFPFRTVTCETSEFKSAQDPQLFAHINIGFNFFNEMFDLGNAEKYDTDIKWELEDKGAADPKPIRENRVKAFAKEAVWVIKSKIMLLPNPSTKFTVFITFPHTMTRPTRHAIEDIWKDAFDTVMGTDNVKVTPETESIAPYYSLISNGGTISENALNIDIGGGTTDMLFADVENTTFYYDSTKFAGDDLWGDGKAIIPHYNKDNGFVKDFESRLEHDMIVSDERKDGYYKYKQTVKRSSDLMSYIFQYDSEFKYTTFIRDSHDKFLPILCVHLAAEMYHVAQVLIQKKIAIPTTITFSGMGSSYIKMISDRNDDITDIVWKLLSSFMKSISGKDCTKPKDFEVQFQKNAKEVTAQGAMLYNHDSLEKIKDWKQEPVHVYGIKDAPEDIEYGKAKNFKDKVLAIYEKFLTDFFDNKKLMKYFKDEYDIKISNDLKEQLTRKDGDSFDSMAESAEDDDTINETMFFWPMKNPIYEATK